MEAVKIYHNPACGTSRNVLGLIRNAGIEPVVIAYLDDIPTMDELKSLCERAGISVRALIRDKEPVFASLDLGEADDESLLLATQSHPVLINRPIVETRLGVRLCRPSELVLEILPQTQRGAFSKEDGEPVVDQDGRPVTKK